MDGVLIVAEEASSRLSNSRRMPFCSIRILVEFATPRTNSADTGHAGTKSRDELPDWYSDRWKHNVRRAGSRHIRTGNAATGIWYPAGDAAAATGTAGECTDPTVSAATHFADTGGRTVYVYGAQGTPGRSLPVFDTTWYRVSHSLRCRKDMIS